MVNNMVIAKKEWFEDKEISNLKICPILDIPWKGVIYFTVMFGLPSILCIIALPRLAIVTGYYQYVYIAIISIAWFTFSIADLLDMEPPDPPYKSPYDEDFIISIRNAGWSMSLVMLIGASVSAFYNVYSWNFYLGLFAITAFVACMAIAITKYRFEKENQNGKYSKEHQIDGE